MSATTLTPSASAQENAATFTDKQRKVALVVVALAFVMDLMDATILNIALPTIREDFNVGNAALQWMAAGYTLAFALLLITGGRLGDVFGYRRMFNIGVVGFMISSLLVGLANGAEVLIVARLLQGATAALMVPQVLSVVQLLYKPAERVAVNSMLGGLSMLATTLAPIVTGLLIKADIAGSSWRPVFLINIPICILALVYAAKYLPAGRSDKRLKVDGFGTLLVIAATGLLVFPLIQGHELGWPGWTVAMMVASIPVIAVFVWWQRRQDSAGGSPLVVPALFRHRTFSVGLLVSLLFFAVVSCFGLTFTLLLQLGHQFSAIHTVLTGLFITLGIVPTVAVLSKKAIPAMGRWSMTLGSVVMAIGTAAVGLVVKGAGDGLSTWQLAPGLVVIGIGMGLVVGPLLPFVLSNVDTSDAGSASGTTNAVQQIGGAFGVALIGLAFFSSTMDSAGFDSGFQRGVWLQVGLLAVCAVLTLLLPRRIAPEAYEQQGP